MFNARFNSSSIDLSAEEGGGTVDLVSGGRDLQVTVYNVYDYVRKYAEYRMIKAQEKALEVRICYFILILKCSDIFQGIHISLRVHI